MAHIQDPFFMFWLALASIFLETTLPLLLRQRSFLVSPPLVYTAVPFQTFLYDPVCIFLVTRFGFLARTALRADVDFGARGFVTVLGALGFLAFLAARRVARFTAL